MKVAIVDYGAGNLPSVERALRKLGAETERATEPGANRCRESDRAARRRPFLGVRRRPARTQSHGFAARRPTRPACRFWEFVSDLQAMFASSEEAPGEAGPRLFPGGSSRAADKREIAAHRLESVARARKRARCFEAFPRTPIFISRIPMRRRLRLKPQLPRAITAFHSRR